MKLYNGDCLELMKELPDGSVDMILDDVPYGTTDCAFDVRLPFEPMWEQFKRVTKRNAAIVLFSQMPFGSDLIQSQKKNFRYEWIWHKNLSTGFLNARKMPLKAHENILVFYQALPTYNPQFTQGKPYTRGGFRQSENYTNGKRVKQLDIQYPDKRFPVDVQKFNVENGRTRPFNGLHPQQKPVDLLEYLIKTYTNEGEVVLDATMGSGSTGVACVNTGRKFIGIELDEGFYKIAQDRIAEAQAKKAQELF